MRTRKPRIAPYNPIHAPTPLVKAPPKPPPPDAVCADCGCAEPTDPDHHMKRLRRCGLDKQWRCGWCVDRNLKAAIARDPYTRTKRECKDCGVQGCLDGAYGEVILWMHDHRDGWITTCVTCRERRNAESDAAAKARQADRRNRRRPARDPDPDPPDMDESELYRPTVAADGQDLF